MGPYILLTLWLENVLRGFVKFIIKKSGSRLKSLLLTFNSMYAPLMDKLSQLWLLILTLLFTFHGLTSLKHISHAELYRIIFLKIKWRNLRILFCLSTRIRKS